VTLFGKLGQLVRQIDRRWCAPKFARRLGPRLMRDYGASRFYSAGQIRAACTKCRLPRRQLALAYAAFLPQAEFETTADVAVRGDYEALRTLLFRFTSSSERSSITPASMSDGIDDTSGMGGGHAGAGSPD